MNLTSIFNSFFPKYPKTLALMRFDGIGDYLFMRVFFPYLRRAKKYQGYRFLLLGRDNFIQLAYQYDANYFDEILSISYPPTAAKQKILVDKLKTYHITELVSPVGALDPEFIVPLFCKIKASKKIAAQAIAMGNADIQSYQKRAYRMIPATNRSTFEFYRYKSFFEQLIDEPIPLSAPYFDLPISSFSNYFDAPYAVFTPFSSDESRNLTVEIAATVARHILHHHTIKKLVILDLNISRTNELIKKINSPKACTKIVNYPEMLSILRNASFLFTVDTSFLHFGAQLRVPTVYVAGNMSYGIFHPYPKSFSWVKGIYPPAFLRNKRNVPNRQVVPQYSVKTLTSEQIITDCDKILNEFKKTCPTFHII